MAEKELASSAQYGAGGVEADPVPRSRTWEGHGMGRGCRGSPFQALESLDFLPNVLGSH